MLVTPLRDKEIVDSEFPPSTLASQGRGVSFSSSTPFSGPVCPLPSRNTPLIHTLGEGLFSVLCKSLTNLSELGGWLGGESESRKVQVYTVRQQPGAPGQ